MTARTTLRDLRRMNDQLSIPAIKLPSATAPTPPTLTLPARPTWVGESDRALVHSWKTYLKWEESNPLDIEDTNVLQARISGAFKKAVIRMRFFPEIWSALFTPSFKAAVASNTRVLTGPHLTHRYMAYHWTTSLGKPEDAAALLKQGMDSNKSS